MYLRCLTRQVNALANETKFMKNRETEDRLNFQKFKQALKNDV